MQRGRILDQVSFMHIVLSEHSLTFPQLPKQFFLVSYKHTTTCADDGPAKHSIFHSMTVYDNISKH